MIEITPSIKIADSEIQFDFIRASGPGGQNVNKLSSAVQLRFDILNSPSLSPEIKERLVRLAGSRVTENGILIIEAKRCRTQDANRMDAINRLVSLIRQAAVPPKIRRRTRPSGASQARRLHEKRRKAEIKQLRKMDTEDWE